jgi:biopolymer transport protein ExbD
MAGSVGDGEFGFQIAPMLDILFVLLLFFMVSAGSQKHETNLTTQLPGNGPAGKVPVMVDIDSDGMVTVNETAVDSATDHAMPQLVGRLQAIIGLNANQPVVVTPSRSTHQERDIDVLNACAEARVKNLAFGAVAD